MKHEKYMMNKALYFVKKGDFVSAGVALEQVEAAPHEPWFSGKDKPKSAKIKSGDLKKLNKALREAGFDGNGRFKSVGEAHNKLADVLNSFGMEIEDTLDAFMYKKNEGRETIHYAFQTDDPHWPVSITNSLLDFSWFLQPSDQFEVLCYAS